MSWSTSAEQVSQGGSATLIPAPVRSHTSSRPPNVLTIVLDCARAKSFARPDGGPVAHTPVLDGLARSGTRFSKAVAPSNWTIPSHMSIFTGDYPNVHGLRGFRRGLPERATASTILAQRGYETALFTEMVHLVAGYGLERGFHHRFARSPGVTDDERTLANRITRRLDVLYSPDVRRVLERLPPLVFALNAMNHPMEVAFKRQVCGPWIVRDFERWIEHRPRERPFFATFNLVDAHEPYDLHGGESVDVGPFARWYARTPRYYLLAVPGLRERVPWPQLHRSYLRAIETADAKIGRIVRALQIAAEYDRTMVVITSDHGQSFGEGGNVFHGCGSTDSITRVPLVVRPPTDLRGPPGVDEWTSLCEMVRWIQAASEGRPPFEDGGPAYHARASAPVFCEGAPASDPNRSLLGIRTEAPWNHRQLAAYQGREKFVLDLVTGEIRRWEETGEDVDARPGDRWTGRDAAELRAAIFEPYEAAEATRPTAPPPGPLEEGIDARLRSWGYD